MKKITLIGALFFSFVASAQLFTDDFESYTTGALGPQNPSWTTWSGTLGGNEDGIVTTQQAQSGSNSVKFSSTAANGGPQDCVLDFGSTYTSGVFTFESSFYVRAGKNAYFNIQAVQPIGTTWAMNVNMDNGKVVIDDGVTSGLANGTYLDDTWFTVTIVANLSTGVWTASIDGVAIGIWQNAVNSVASVDFYPIQGSDFYIDDVMFDHQAYTTSTLNAGLAGFSMNGTVASQNVSPTVTIINSGSTTLTSFDVDLTYNGATLTENVTGVSLASQGTYEVTFTGVTLVAGTNNVDLEVSNPNGGGADEDATDDMISIAVTPIVPAVGKMVVSEEGTGTWCGYCVRGAVFMEEMNNKYGSVWAGIAVHNGDPMVVTDYDSGIGNLIDGYPKALVDRGAGIDPSAMEAQILSRLEVAPTAFITNGATWNATTRELKVSISADFQVNATNAFKLAAVLVENGVTGTTSGYNQSNYYAGGGLGEMGGYENLPSTVPASQMVYDHVARALAPSFSGLTNSFPATVNSGETHTVNFVFTLPAEWDENEIEIVSLLINGSGRIDNAGKATIDEAVANGFVAGVDGNAGIAIENQIDSKFEVYPNPATTTATIAIILEQESAVSMAILDMSGKVVAARNYGNVNGASTVTVNTSNFNAGVYMVELTVNNVKTIKKLIIQ
jgi:hypothetical protein